jgi:hypothetical protein
MRPHCAGVKTRSAKAPRSAFPEEPYHDVGWDLPLEEEFAVGAADGAYQPARDALFIASASL